MSQNKITFSEAIIPLTIFLTVIGTCVITWEQDHRVTYSFLIAFVMSVILIALMLMWESTKGE